MEQIKHIDFETDYSFLLRISKIRLQELQVLEEYLYKRGGDKFDDDGYDYITIFQARLIGIINIKT